MGRLDGAALFATGVAVGLGVAYASQRLAKSAEHQSHDAPECDEPLKMVLVVRNDLKMGKGKSAPARRHQSKLAA